MTLPKPGEPADPRLTVSEGDHRDFMSAFPTGVTVVTALDQAGLPHGLTCTSLASVTVTPPTLLVCLDTRSGTLDAIRHGGRFAVNLLHSGARRAAEIFSSAVPDRFDKVEWRLSKSAGQPWLIKDAFAVAGCAVLETTVVGDHEVVLGEVREVEQASGLPLMYGMRRFSFWCGVNAQESIGV